MKVAVPGYLPPLTYMAALVREDTVYFRQDTQYQKQTHRNRAHIYGANGTLKLTIPIAHTPTQGHRMDRDVALFNTTPWQNQHWKSLQAAYRSSPYFEFYEEELHPFFSQTFPRLFDFNVALIEVLFKLMDVPKTIELVETPPANAEELSHYLNAKGTHYPTPEYIQVFASKHGFIANLSCVDALFNMGPATASYLLELEKTLAPNQLG